MHLRLTYPAPFLLALLGPACVIDPGVLEGDSDTAGDELGDATSDTSDTPPETSDVEPSTSDDSDTGGDDDTGAGELLPECLRGTNLQGGSDPGDYTLNTCAAFTCDEGWGHGDIPQLEIAWTLAFDEDVGESERYPVGLVARDDELLVVARRDAGPQLARVSSEGQLLELMALPTSLHLSAIVEREGILYLDAFDESDSSNHVIATTEQGELLWDLELEGSNQQMLVADDALLVAGTDAGEGWLRRVTSSGSVAWTVPTPRPVSFTRAPSGRIVVTGSYIGDGVQRLHILAPDGSFVGELPLLGDASYLIAMHLSDNTTLTGIGKRYEPWDGVVERIDLGTVEVDWHHVYNRATNNCIAGFEEVAGEPTKEHFNAMAVLPDGSFLIAATEDAEYIEATPRESPRVLHVAADGQLLAADRGLWSGAASSVAVAPEGSAYVALPRDTYLDNEIPSSGFYVRKYLP